MKHIYVTLVAMSTALSLISENTRAQSPTTVANSNQCNVLHDFNADNGAFRSPSIYTESNYTQFNWDAQAGYWIETSGLANRSASMISSIYENKQNTGGIVVGFKYEAPAGAEYRIRIINVSCGCSGGSDLTGTSANGPEWALLPATSGRLCLQLLDQDFVKGQKIRFEISVRSLVPGNFIIDDFSLSEIAEGPLPVTFLGMVANRNNNNVNLKWDVADESGVKEYQIERSTTGGSFTKAGTIAAGKKAYYTYTDAGTEATTLFYRIKSIDLDGQFKYSSIIRLTGNSSYASSLKLYPMPAVNNTTIEHKRLDSRATITIATIDGKVLKTIVPANGASHTPLNLSDIPTGVYIVKLEDGQGNVESTKLIKR